MSADVSESLEKDLEDKSAITLDTRGAEDNLPQDGESSYLGDSDEFTDWSGDEDNSQNLDDDLESNFSEKRYSGDGEEQPAGVGDRNQRFLDDDEDRKNPAYVPRKGSFFEHDLRRGDGDHCHDGKKVKEKPGERRRGLWSCDRSRWEHDRFDERSQRPKSIHELVTIYGFNIRKELRSMGGFKRLGSRNRMRASLLNGSISGRSVPSIFPRKGCSSKRGSLRTFIVVRNDGRTSDGDESAGDAGYTSSARNDVADESKPPSSNCPLDFDKLKGTNRFIEEPIICFAPKRGEKVNLPAEAVEARSSSCCDGSEEPRQEAADVKGRSEEIVVCPEGFGRGGFGGGGFGRGGYGVPKKKKVFAGSGRIAPVSSGRGKKFGVRCKYGEMQNEESNYSSDEVGCSSVERPWNSFPSQDSLAGNYYRGHHSTSSYRGSQRSRFRGRFRSTSRMKNYYYDGTFPQDVRLIVMCGDGGNENEGTTDEENRTKNLSSAGKNWRSETERPSLVTGQGGLISDILPPVTCCARTRTNRSSVDSVVYSLAQMTTSPATTTTTTAITASSSVCSAVGSSFENTPEPAEGQDKMPDGRANASPEKKLDDDSKSDASVEKAKSNVVDRRYSSQRAWSEGKAVRNRSCFNPRFPVPPRNRVFHPNNFNNPAISSFLPAAFILPTGPIFHGPRRHPALPPTSAGYGRGNVPQILGLNSHPNPPHPHQLLALPLRVTPVPFIIASSQALPPPSGQQLSHAPSPPRMLPSSSSLSSSQCATSTITTSASSSAQVSSSSSTASRPTSLFQAGPQRSTPHPKHWFRFNSRYCSMLKPPPISSSFHHSIHFRPALSGGSNFAAAKTANFVPQRIKETMSIQPTSSAATAAAAAAADSASSSVPATTLEVLPSSSSSSTIVAASKLSPHAAAFRSSRANYHDPDTRGSESTLVCEMTPARSKYWQRSHRACPIEVRGGTVYFSPEVQQLQYKCYSGSKKGTGSVYGLASGNVVYFNPEGRHAVQEGKKDRDKKVLSIVDPKSLESNRKEVATSPVLERALAIDIPPADDPVGLSDPPDASGAAEDGFGAASAPSAASEVVQVDPAAAASVDDEEVPGYLSQES